MPHSNNSLSTYLYLFQFPYPFSLTYASTWTQMPFLLASRASSPPLPGIRDGARLSGSSPSSSSPAPGRKGKVRFDGTSSSPPRSDDYKPRPVGARPRPASAARMRVNGHGVRKKALANGKVRRLSIFTPNHPTQAPAQPLPPLFLSSLTPCSIT